MTIENDSLAELGLVQRTLAQMPFLPRRARLAGSPEMAEIHRLASRLVVDGRSGREAAAMRLIDCVWWPFFVWSRLRRLRGEGLRVAAEDAGRRPIAHLLTAWWFCTRFGIPPHEYHAFALYRPEIARHLGDFLVTPQSHRIYHTLFTRSDEAEMHQWVDKLAFHAVCRDHGIRCAHLLAVANEGKIRFHDEPGSPAWNRDIIMKPQIGSNGSGFYRWQFQTEGSFVGALGETVSLDDILRQIARFSAKRPILVEQRIVNDEATSRLSGGALATVRVVTGRDAAGTIELIAAAIKMPVGGALVDNYMRGNVLAQIDRETGVMAAGQYYFNHFKLIDSHPDTGVKFAGRQAPQWDEIVGLALSTHARAPRLAVLAFDIAPTAQGPLLVEVNTRGDLAMVQHPGGKPIGQSPYPRIVLSHFAKGGRVRGDGQR